MIQIHEALERLQLDLSEFHGSLLGRPVEPESYLHQLSRTVLALEERFDSASAPKPSLDPEEVWAKWRAAHYELDRLDAREIRTLCVSPKTAMRAQLVAALHDKPEALKRPTTLNGFVQAYFCQWRTMEAPELVEELIHQALEPSRILRKSRVLDTWRRSRFLFSPEASKRIGEFIVRERKPVKQTCEEFYIELFSPVVAEATKQATLQAVNSLCGRHASVSQEDALKELQWISTHLLTSALGADVYRTAMSTLIVSRLPERMPLFQAALVDLVHADERLGDPRLSYCAPNWRSVPQEAKERFLAWLARETLQFFFDTLVPRNDKNRRRAEFWLEYAKKQGKIKDFQVAVSDNDRPKILASRTKTVPKYSTITGGQTSAFLMVFEGFGTEYVVIEFSETGHAAYIYSRSTFESAGVTIRSQSFNLSGNLRRMGAAHDRILHLTDTRERWETKARKKLAELGIRP
jgi:hypothetical protein